VAPRPRTDPFDPAAHAILAASRYFTAAVPAAVAAATTALDLDPIEPTARWMLVLALLRDGDLAAARSAFETARHLDAMLRARPSRGCAGSWTGCPSTTTTAEHSPTRSAPRSPDDHALFHIDTSA
jgi:hypothetical protein